MEARIQQRVLHAFNFYQPFVDLEYDKEPNAIFHRMQPAIVLHVTTSPEADLIARTSDGVNQRAKPATGTEKPPTNF